MNNRSFIVFLVIALSIYALVNTYIYFRAKEAFIFKGWQIWIFSIVFAFVVLAFPLGHIVRGFYIGKLENFLTVVGSWWLGAIFYLFLILVLIDVVRLSNHFLHFSPAFILSNKILTGRIFSLLVSVLVLGILVYGYFNALAIRITTVKSDKGNPLSSLGLRAVLFSDVHLGILVNKERFQKVVDKVNDLEPDIIFIVGDLLDENVEGLKDIASQLGELKSKFGVFAVTGNHEFYVGVEKAVNFMESAGVKVLRNEVASIDGRLNIVGMDDNTALGFGKKIPILKEVIKDIDRKLPTILLYHKPINFDVAKENGINLMLCGHIHGGQLFPVKFLTNWIYKLNSRDFTLGDMRVFISNGVGTWGPPVRVGANPEIVVLEFR